MRQTNLEDETKVMIQKQKINTFYSGFQRCQTKKMSKRLHLDENKRRYLKLDVEYTSSLVIRILS